MSLSLENITLDCADPRRQSAFWADALGRTVDDGGSQWFCSIGVAADERPRWLFLAVPEPKTAKNRMHVDFGCADREVEIERLVGLGATRGADHDEFGHSWTVMADPEGNEFCVG